MIYCNILSGICLAFRLIFYLAFFPTFYLTYILTFYLTFNLAFYLAFHLTFDLAFHLTFYPTFSLTFFLAFYLPGPAGNTRRGCSWLRSGREHLAWMVVVEVRQGTLGVDDRG